MSQAAGKQLFTAFEDGRGPESLCYEEMRLVAARWIHEAEAGFGELRGSGDFAETKRVLQRQPLAELTQRFCGGSALAGALRELFLLSRLRQFVLPYLGMQEGLVLEQRGGVQSHPSRLMAEVLASMGKRPWVQVGFPLWRWRVRVELDPLLHMRRAYGRILRLRRTGERPGFRDVLFLRYQTWMFKARTLALRGLLALVFGLLTHGRISARRLQRFFRTKTGRRNLGFGLLLLFPGAKNLSHEDWKRLMDALESDFAPKLARFSAIAGRNSLADHGFIKLLKIGFGVVVWRLSTLPAKQKTDEVDSILETLRLAYSWGTTYPLVDNVLDDAQTTPGMREELMAGLYDVFQRAGRVPGTGVKHTHEGVCEACARLEEVMALVPETLKQPASRVLLLLAESHHRDSSRKLSACTGPLTAEEEEQLWQDSLLKAALIRMATVVVCGVPLEQELARRLMLSSLVNQLGDDLWDIYQDFEADRLTPFTAYLHGLTRRNPFLYFLQYCRLVATRLPGRRKTALLIGVQETIRCFLEAVEARGSDPLKARQHLDDALKECGAGFTSEDVRGVPHVDPDAVLFALESSIWAPS